MLFVPGAPSAEVAMASSPSATLVPASQSLLFRLPSVTLSQVCSYTRPEELLVSLARTSNATRELLTADCFSTLPVRVDMPAQWRISDLGPESRHALRSFRSRVLAECRVALCVGEESPMSKVLVALDCFPVCKALIVEEVDARTKLSESRPVQTAPPSHRTRLQRAQGAQLLPRS